jgi:hypothetical protein
LTNIKNNTLLCLQIGRFQKKIKKIANTQTNETILTTDKAMQLSLNLKGILCLYNSRIELLVLGAIHK